MDLSRPDTLCVYCGTDLERIRQLEEAIQKYYDALMALPDDVFLPPGDATILYFKARRKLLDIGGAELHRRAGKEGG